MVKPQIKYSKRANDLMKAERELIRLCQYDDARKVRNMLERIIPAEEKQFEKCIEHKKLKAIEDLKKSQRIDELRLDEKLKGKKWNCLRRNEREQQMYDSLY
jgi:hypothetical protein